MGTRLGAAVLVMLMASMGPAGAVVRETGAARSGAIGAIAPGIEVAGWVTDPAGRGAPQLFIGDLEDLPAGAGFIWADVPYPMGVGQGVAVVGADDWQLRGWSGGGIAVAVIDLGFSGYQGLVGSELPDGVIARSFRSDGGMGSLPHGTAAAEIVHEVAPGAELHLLSYDYSLGPVIDYLIAEDIDVVSFSVGYLSGPLDGTSPVAVAVQRALDAGIVWVTAAGNYAHRHWGGTPGDGDGWVGVDGADEINEFEVAAGDEFHLYLSWLGDADLDLCLYEVPASLGDPLACAAGVQTADSRPLEVVMWENDSVSPQRYGFAVRNVRGGADRVDVFGWNIHSLEHPVAASSIVVPGDVTGAVTVGAVPWSDPSSAASFSSRGPTVDGRPKPDLVAPSGVSTRAAGAFVGTSASAPHVAGLAALLLAAYPATTATEVPALLAHRAASLGPAHTYGAGLAMAGPRHRPCYGHAPTVVGTSGADVIEGTGARDVISALGGDDVVRSRGGDDLVCAGSGDDLVRGGSGDDRLIGNSGDDELFGGGMSDRVLGGGGDDVLWGGSGKDLLRGGSGDDRGRGGGGIDRCSGGSFEECERVPR
jgi:subtilisin family serine protease